MTPTTRKTSGKVRDARTGRYVTKDEAERRPEQTVVEHDRAKQKRRKRRKARGLE